MWVPLQVTVTRKSKCPKIVDLRKTWMQVLLETSTYGSASIAMKKETECLWGLWYTLQMFDIPVYRPSLVFGDSQFVLCNTLCLNQWSTINAKEEGAGSSFPLCEWGLCRGGVVCGVQPKYTNKHLNVADLMTKSPCWQKAVGFC